MKNFGWIVGAVGIAAVALPTVASAQDYETQYGSDQGNVTVESEDTTVIQGERVETKHQERDRGVSVTANGGVISFPGEAAADLTPGGNYGVNVGIEPLPVVELELGYVGAAYQTDGNLPGAQENVIENGGQAVLKASPKIGVVEPYAFGGYQLSWFNVYERPNSAGVVEDKTLSKLPVGAGLDFHIGDAVLGARGQYNFVFAADQAFTNLNSDQARSADQLAGLLELGGQF